MRVKGLRTQSWPMVCGLMAGLLLSACTSASIQNGLGPNTVIGFVVVDADTGTTLTMQNPDRAFIPASTAKVPTMISALELLGPDYRFHTDILATKIPDKAGNLNGDLILKGGGDPLLSPQDLLGLATRLKDLGLRRVTGRFLYDDSLLPASSVIDADQPVEARYNPGISALSLDFNRWRLRWQTDAKTNKRTMTILPPLDIHQVRLGQQREGPGRSVLWRDGGWHLSADAPADGDRTLPVKDPARATAHLFRALAMQIGVDLPFPEPGVATANAQRAARLDSLPLAEIARLGLEHSNNLVAELVGLTAHRLAIGRPAVLADSANGISNWLQRTISATTPPRTDWRLWKMDNHSGLSQKSRITPRHMALVLRHAHARRYGAWPFISFLPTAGYRRAFRNRYLTPSTMARLWAKTGTLNYAKGLAGYFLGLDGRTRIFALYIADPSQRRTYDHLSAADPAARDHPDERARARAWIDAAEAKEEQLILSWFEQF